MRGPIWKFALDVEAEHRPAAPVPIDYEQRIGDATRRIGEPFPHSAELETARTRRDAIETSIRDAAEEPPEPGSEPADDSGDDVYVIDPLDADGDRERIVIRPVTSLPNTRRTLVSSTACRWPKAKLATAAAV